MITKQLPLTFSALYALIATAPALASETEAPAPQRPNVIFLMADDLGYGDLQCYGAKNVETPNADRVASEGIRFSQCHATAATSTPSRYSILTGQYAWRKPGTNVLPGDAAMIIDADQYTIADMFHDAGYATAAIGKWHLGLGTSAGQQNWNGRLDHTPSSIGFDYHYIQAATADRVPCVYLEQDTIANYDPSAPIQVSYTANFEGEPTGATNRDELKLDWTHGHNQSIVDGISRIGYMKGGGKALWKDENIADSIADHSRRFIMENKERPFFMYLCTNDVHVPRWPHDRFRGKNPMGLRGDAISSFDWTVGQVLQALEDAGVADNTLLIITSDNGPVIDDGYDDKAFELLNGHTPTAGRRGDKYSNYEGGTSVPLIVRWPDRVRPQEGENATLMSLIDIYASLGALIGAELPEGAAPDSGDMLAQLLGESKEHRPWVSELGTKNTICVRTDRWKYIPATAFSGALGWPATGHDGTTIDTGDRTAEQLFDLENDPTESTNVATEQPDVLKAMREVYKDAADLPTFDEPALSGNGSEFWFNIHTPLRENRYMMQGADLRLKGGTALDRYNPAAQWEFLEATDGGVYIVNRASGRYVSPDSLISSDGVNILTASAARPSKGWTFDYGTIDGVMIIQTADGGVQLNQGPSGRQYKIVDYKGGHTDAGCQFAITPVADADATFDLPRRADAPVTSTAGAPKWFVMFTPDRENRYLCSAEGAELTGIASTKYYPELAWRLEERPDGKIDIINRHTGLYIAPAKVAGGGNQLAQSAASPAAGWEIKPIGSTGKYSVVSGSVQLHQTNSSNSYKIFDWGGGNNITDAGCKYQFTEITDLLASQSRIAEIGRDKGADGSYYTISGHRVSSPRHGIFITSSGKKVIL